MFELKACIVCLKSDVKVFSMNTGQLRKEYNIVSGLKTNSHNRLLEYLCYQCVAHIRNFKRFRDKCQRTYYALQEVVHRNKEITKIIIDEIDTKILKIEPNLSYLALNHSRTKYESTEFKWIKQNQVGLKHQDEIPVFQYTTTSDDLMFEVPRKKAKLLKDLVEEFVKDEDDTIAPLEPSLENEKAVVETVVNDSIFDNNFDNCEENDDDDNNEINVSHEKKSKDQDADGMNLEEEYATMVPISIVEAKAVLDVYKMLAQGKFQCTVCGKGFHIENRLNAHMRMHDPHTSGSFYCGLCNYYYKSAFVLKNHMTEKHMYKYLCKKCSEVNFDRTSAKQHFILAHLQKGSKNDKSLCESQTSADTKGKKKNKLFKRQCTRNLKILPKDFLLYSPISQEEQYAIIKERQKTKNYIDSPFKCEYCYKGFREDTTYKKHMKKHDPAYSGKLQCDVCKLYWEDVRSLYKHMTMCHIYKYSCQMCSYVCYCRGQANQHYDWHKNVTYTCPHCDKEFTKASSHATHIRINHPSTYICNLCGHSFVSVTGLYCHKKLAHTKQELEENTGAPDPAHALYCAECDMQFRDEAALATHYKSSGKHADTNLSIKTGKRRGKRRTTKSSNVNTGLLISTTCEICNEHLQNDKQVTRHYDAEHPGAPYPKRYMCDICGHKTRQHENIVVHIRTHTQEKPYKCPHCDRRFSMRTNRDRHIVVHTGEKRYECSHCNRRFTQKGAVKLHIQTVHLKIPYPPWTTKYRKRRRDLDSAVPCTQL